MAGGGPTWQQTTGTSTSAPDPFINAAGQSLINQINGLQVNPYMGAVGTGTGAAGTALQNQYTAGLQGLLGSGQGLGQSNALINRAMSGTIPTVGTSQVTAGTITPETYAAMLANGGINQYMNPWIGAVADTSKGLYQQQFGNALNTLGANAAGMGAYGGSRQGVQEGAAAAQNALDYGNYVANLYNTGYNTATGLMGQDIGNNLQAQTSNVANALAASQANAANTLAASQANATNKLLRKNQVLAAAGQRAQNANSRFTNQLAGLNALGTQANAQAAQTAANNQAAYNEWLRQQNYNAGKIGLGISALGTIPHGTTTNMTNNSIGMVPQQGSSNSALGMAGGILSGIGSLFGTGGIFGLSEDSAKTDVQKIGKTDEGLNLYAYRYKGDSKTYPKVVGPMASEVEKLKPNAVVRMGKHGPRMVDYKSALGLS